MRDHRLIREISVDGGAGGASQTFDFETGPFENILVTWSNADDSGAAVTAIILCPTNGKRATLTSGNFPGLPAAPAAGFNAYASVGPNMSIPQSLPYMLTAGVICPAGVRCSVRVEGDVIANILPNPNPVQRARS